MSELSAGNSSSRNWLPVAAALVAVGWGSNQFSPMLLVYQQTLGLDSSTLTALFGIYALGLIPGLLLSGPLSDRFGRKPVVVPGVVLSFVASVVLISGEHSSPLLFLGRLLVGISTGAALGAGTAWLREISVPPYGDGTPTEAARRAAIAVTTGFGIGPLLSGALAQWAPAPAIVPYLPHLTLTAAVIFALPRTRETLTDAAGVSRIIPPGLALPRFRRVVAPMAPWVFATPAIAFAFLPNAIDAANAADGIAITAAVTSATALAGVLIQPLGRRIDAGGDPESNRAGVIGLLVAAVGMGLGALTAATGAIWLLFPSAIVLGSAYGLCLVSGLMEIQRMAGDDELGSLTAVFYVLTYVGFAAPFLLTVLDGALDYPTLLLIAAGLALGTAALVSRSHRVLHAGAVAQSIDDELRSRFADRPTPLKQRQ